MEFSDFYNRIPFITRCWLTITVGLSLLATVQFLEADKLPLYWEQVFRNNEIWRPLTAVFYCPPHHFFFIINNYFLYRYSEKLESREFAGRPDDYLMLLVFNWIFCVACAYWFGFHLLMSTMVMSVVTVWCQFNPHAVIRTEYWDGMHFKASYLPWAIVGANIMYSHRYGYAYGYFGHGATLTSKGTEEFAGILAGYLAYFLLVQYPHHYGGASLLQAPVFLKNWLAGVRGFFNTPGAGPRPQHQRNTYNNENTYHPWGRGYTCRPNPPRCSTEARMN